MTCTGHNGLKVVLTEPLPGQLFELRARAAIIGIRMDGNAATGRKETRDLDVTGIHELDQVLHDDVDAILMEVAMVAKRKQIEFQTLAFNHPDVWNITDDDVGEIRLSGDGAEAGELRAIELDPIVILGMFVDKRLKHLGSIILLVDGLLVAEQGERFFFAALHN